MAGNWGLGIGSFLGGLTTGVAAGEKINDARDRREANELAKTQRQQVKDINTQGVAAAKTSTDGKADSVMDFYMKNTAPQLQQYWMEQGEPEKAQAFGKWIQDSNVQQGMKYGAGMIRGAQIGDPQMVMDNLVKAYNTPGYYDDGMTAVSAKLRQDKDGNASGMDIILRDQAGKESTHTFNNMEDVYKTAMQFGSPENVFAQGMNELQAAQKIKTSQAEDSQKWQQTVQGKALDNQYGMARDNNNSNLRRAEKSIESKATANKTRQDAETKIDMLKRSGKSQPEIDALMPNILGIENKSRPTSSRVDDYIKLMTESDREFRKLPQNEQIGKAIEYIQNSDAATGDAGGAGLGMPRQSTPQGNNSGGGGRLVYDTKTGQMISR